MVNYALKLSRFFIVFLFTGFLFAQDFQGTAYYMSKTDVDMSQFGRPDMTEDQKKRMAERLKTMFEKTYVLSFNRLESIYKVKEELEAPNQGRGGRFSAIMSGAIDGVKYKNVKTKDLLSEHELFGKLFLIMDTLPQLQWKITGETKQIGTYTCFKATAIKDWADFDVSSLRRAPNGEDSNSDIESNKEENDEPMAEQVVAWYTMQIPVNQGPGDYWGLPGLILEINTANTTILCSKIVLNPKEKLAIKQPNRGKEVSKEEYVDIATKKYQEMRENFRRGRR
nr:GLPGLI family protein [Algibacter onchidii]